MNKPHDQKNIAANKKARHLYELSEFTEAGISLLGPEVKSLRNGQVSFTDSYVEIRKGQAILMGLHIAPYRNASTHVETDPLRDRVLLLHAREIRNLGRMVEQKGYTIVPVRLYFKRGRIKVEIALARGKKLYDHREDLKKRAGERDLQRGLAD